MARRPGPREARPESKLRAGHPVEDKDEFAEKNIDTFCDITFCITWVARICGP
jgi:hypothetical protein